MEKIVSLEEMILFTPKQVTKILEEKLRIKNLFMIVGRPGSGKSTFLDIAARIDNRSFYIDTDKYSKSLRPLLEECFGGSDLVEAVINQPQRLIEVISRQWLEMAAASLSLAPPQSNVFVEIPYGMRPEFRMFRYFGAKVIYIGCENEEVNRQRIRERGNPQTIRFIEVIPDKKQTMDIAAQYDLRLICIDTSGTLNELKDNVTRFLKNI